MPCRRRGYPQCRGVRTPCPTGRGRCPRVRTAGIRRPRRPGPLDQRRRASATCGAAVAAERRRRSTAVLPQPARQPDTRPVSRELRHPTPRTPWLSCPLPLPEPRSVSRRPVPRRSMSGRPVSGRSSVRRGHCRSLRCPRLQQPAVWSAAAGQVPPPPVRLVQRSSSAVRERVPSLPGWQGDRPHTHRRARRPRWCRCSFTTLAAIPESAAKGDACGHTAKKPASRQGWSGTALNRTYRRRKEPLSRSSGRGWSSRGTLRRAAPRARAPPGRACPGTRR